jgi:DNA-binding response OmpR family regulator
MARVLVVEDDQFVRSALIRHLSDASHTVRSVGTALEALREVAQVGFDVVILDLGLPDLDGGEALKMLRGITDVPVIVATARDDEGEIVRLLNDGADDYLVKPFSVEHLSARMAAVLRRFRATSGAGPGAPGGAGDPAGERVLRVGGLAIDPLRRQAELDGRSLDLTRREFDLLAFLAERPGVVVSRKQLLAEVWQLSYGDDQTIDVHLSWLRRKLGETAARPRYLRTLRGVGVKLEAPGADDPAPAPPPERPRQAQPRTRRAPRTRTTRNRRDQQGPRS